MTCTRHRRNPRASTRGARQTTDFALVLTGTVIATIPMLVVFALLGRQIIGGIMSGAIKG